MLDSGLAFYDLFVCNFGKGKSLFDWCWFCRLIVLFPKLDVSPADGFVTESELTEWNMQSSAKEVIHRTQRDMDVHDRNKDGFISFSEYEPPSWVRNSGEPLL